MAREEGLLPIRWDLTGEDAITQGSYWARGKDLYYIDPNTDTEVMLDTTGYTGVFTIRNTFDGPVIFQGTTSDGVITVGGSHTFIITLVAAATSRTANPTLHTLGLGYWDIELTDPYGHTMRYYHGRAALSKEVSY